MHNDSIWKFVPVRRISLKMMNAGRLDYLNKGADRSRSYTQNTELGRILPGGCG